jgi:hypothetical protein
MAAQEPQPITVLLRQWLSGDPSALAAITPIVYDELHFPAAKFLAKGSLQRLSTLSTEAGRRDATILEGAQ